MKYSSDSQTICYNLIFIKKEQSFRKKCDRSSYPWLESLKTPDICDYINKMYRVHVAIKFNTYLLFDQNEGHVCKYNLSLNVIICGYILNM